MAKFLKIISFLYLVAVWAMCVGVMQMPTTTGLVFLMAPLAALTLSLPAAVLYAFGQIVDDISAMRYNSKIQCEHLHALRRYYEPQETTPRAEPRF